MLRKNSYLFFIFELDGVVKTPKRIAFSRTRDKIVSEDIPALSDIGRIDKKIELPFWTNSQVERFANHFLLCTKLVATWTPMQLRIEHLQKTPAQLVHLGLANP